MHVGYFLLIVLKRKTNQRGDYANLLQHLSVGIKKKRPDLAEKKVLFHLDNTPVHTSVIATAKINELKFVLLPHRPYSPDLASSGYFLFLNLRKLFDAKRFPTNEVYCYFEEF